MDEPRDDRTALLLALGRGLHQAGLSTDALEDVLHDVAVASGVALQVNVLPTSMILAVGTGFTQRVVVLRLDPGKLHLRKLAQLETVVDAVRRGLAPGEALAAVTQIDTAARPDHPLVTVGAYAVLATGTALLIGGQPGDVAASAVAGTAIGIIGALAQRSQRVDRVFEISAAFVATVIIALWERAVAPVALYVVLVAAIVQLLPGYSLTTALGELANRNVVSGTARLGGVFVTLLSLGCGFALGSAVGGPTLMSSPTIGAASTTWFSSLGAGALMALGIALILHARARDVGWIVVAALATIAISRLFALFGITVAAPFLTAFALGLATIFAARYLRIPRSVVLVPALLVLVPGSISYESLLSIFQQADTTDAVSLASRALLTAILIVAGFLTSQLAAAAARTGDT
ncbi:MAG TPA: threonine/serine exporter family protein [Candidatus Elarobacter sp.]